MSETPTNGDLDEIRQRYEAYAQRDPGIPAADIPYLLAEVESLRRQVTELIGAARGLIDTWDNTSTVDPDAAQIAAGYCSLMSIEDTHALESAFDRVSQLVGEDVAREHR